MANEILETQVAREEMLKQMEKLFGQIKEDVQDGSSVTFSNYTSRQIAEMLGYDDGQMTRILKPNFGKDNTSAAYRRVTQRVNMLLENRQLRKSAKHQKLPWVLCGILLVACVTLLWIKPTASQSTDGKAAHILTKEERYALHDLYSKLLKDMIVIEAVRQHSTFKEGKYPDGGKASLEDLPNRMIKIVNECRDMLRPIHLEAENGVPLVDLYERYADNQPAKNVQMAVPFLQNKELSSYEISNKIIEIVTMIQQRNRERIDHAIDSMQVANSPH